MESSTHSLHRPYMEVKGQHYPPPTPLPLAKQKPLHRIE